MSFKTDRLAALFPDLYAVREGDALLHRLLDALGAELLAADATLKALLKSHWIDYATGGGLDGLGTLLGVSRRLLPDDTQEGDDTRRLLPEGDDTFRSLVRSTVPSFIGGGTLEAIKGAVRAALGLPYDLDLFAAQQAGPGGTANAGLTKLVAGLRDLVQIEEFSPKAEVVLGSAAPTVAGTTTTLAVDFPTVQPVAPRIEWTFTQGGGRRLRLVHQETGAGVVSKGEFEVPQGSTLVLAGAGPADFSASIGTSDLSFAFAAIDGTSPPALPAVPAGASRWVFSAARAGEFDHSSFDQGETYDAAAFCVRMAWVRYQPLVFDVAVPYFVDAAVRRILAGTGYEGRFRVFKELSRDAIQRVVDHHRAAGVRGMVQYSLRLPGESAEATPWDDQSATDVLSGTIEARQVETHDTGERLSVGALDSALETHDARERFAIGGVFNVSVCDGSFGFQ